MEDENKALEEHMLGLEAHVPLGDASEMNYLMTESLESLNMRLSGLKVKHGRLQAEHDTLSNKQSRAKSGVVRSNDLQAEGAQLEAELMEITRQQAIELSELQLKGWEAQTMAAGGFGGAASMILNEMSGPRSHTIPQHGETIGHITLHDMTMRNPSSGTPPPRLNPLL